MQTITLGLFCFSFVSKTDVWCYIQVRYVTDVVWGHSVALGRLYLYLSIYICLYGYIHIYIYIFRYRSSCVMPITVQGLFCFYFVLKMGA